MTSTATARELPPELVGIDARTLPHNLEAERSVLGAILVHNDAFEQARHLKPGEFFRKAHSLLFIAMSELLEERGRAIDFVTLREELSRRGWLDEVGGPAYVSSLGDGVPRATNVKFYVQIVKEKAALRSLIFTANTMLTDAYAAEDSPAEIVNRADLALIDLQNANYSDRMHDIATSSTALFADIEKRVARRGQLSGVPTGFNTVDELTFGWQPGDLIILAARPSIGKTTFAMNTAVAAAQAGVQTAIFSMEMRRRQLEYRLMASLSGVACTRLVSGTLGAGDYPKITTAFEQLRELPLAIDDRGHQTVQDVRAACRRLRAERGLGLVVIDYVQLMAGSLTRKGATRNEEITDISRRLKVLADDIQAPIILISQLRRLAARTRPQLDDLRESGALEQDSDIVCFLHRANHRVPGKTECILAKQRNGPTGTVRLQFDGDTLTFTVDQTPEPAEPEPDEDEKKRRRQRHFQNRWQND